MANVEFLNPGDKRSMELLKEILGLAGMLVGGNFPSDQAEKVEKFLAGMREPEIKEAVIIPVKDEREIAVPKKKDMAVPSQPPQSSPIKIVANDDIQEEPVYLIGEFEENQHKVHDTKKFSLNSQRLLKFLNNPDGYATGWHAETLSALEDFVTKYEIGELYLQEKSMEVLSAINARNCLLGKPDGGLAFIRIRNNDQIISWPNFNKDLLGKVIGPDGIEHDQIADIIHIAVPHCDMTSVTFYRFPPPPPQKNHGFAKKM